MGSVPEFSDPERGIALDGEIENEDENRVLDGISVCEKFPPIPTDTIGYFPSVRDKDTWIPMILDPLYNFEGWCFKHGATFLAVRSSNSTGTMGPVMHADWENSRDPTLIPRVLTPLPKRIKEITATFLWMVAI